MAYQVETPGDWPLGVYQLAVTDPVLGGADGPPNLMGRALANRTVYQRLRNVTPWLADLAAAHGYPAGACVRHGATTWRAIVDNNVAPGTDPTKWERWGYSESELAAYLRGSLLSPVRCPVTGPTNAPSAASPYTMWQSVAPYNEYWAWLGDVWKVVANRYTMATFIASAPLSASTQTAICHLVAPRDGKAVLRGIFSALNSPAATTEALSHIRRVRAGVTTLLAESVSEGVTTALNHYVHGRPYTVTDVLAGDTYYLLGLVNAPVAAHPQNQNSIHLEYLQ
jgi:hypothetical protein